MLGETDDCEIKWTIWLSNETSVDDLISTHFQLVTQHISVWLFVWGWTVNSMNIDMALPL